MNFSFSVLTLMPLLSNFPRSSSEIVQVKYVNEFILSSNVFVAVAVACVAA